MTTFGPLLHKRGILVVPFLVSLSLMFLVPGVAPAAEAPGPGWELTSHSYPTNFSPESVLSPRVSGTIAVDIFNVGAGPAGCTATQYGEEIANGVRHTVCPETSPPSNPITITDTLPAGVRATEAGNLEDVGEGGTKPTIGSSLWECTGNGPGAAPRVMEATVVTCVNKPVKLSGGERDLGVFEGGGGTPTEVTNEAIHILQPALGIAVDVQPGAQEHETNSVTIAGGGAPTSAGTSNPVTISSAKPAFGLADWDGWFSKADGTLDTQAGSHPYEATFGFEIPTFLREETGGKLNAQIAGAEVKTVEVELPPGFVGNPTAAPQCPRDLFVAERCPQASIIGRVATYFAGFPPLAFPVLNLVPPPGVPAEFGLTLQGLNTYLDAGVRSGGDYGITEHVSDIAHKEIKQAITTIWGDPGAHSHDPWRVGTIYGCAQREIERGEAMCGAPDNNVEKPFLTLPTACRAPQPFIIRATSWSGQHAESEFFSHDSNDNPTGFTGCRSLAFGPAITTAPDTSDADTPAGLTVDVQPPLGGLEELEGLGSSDIQDTTVTLPPGFVINPGQAAGLQACGPAEDGLTSEAEKAEGKEDNGPPSCPNASKVGTVRAKTPLLEGSAEKELEGNVYVMQSNPPHLKLLAAFSADGVNIKLVLNVELDERTGQITTRVVNVPELPASDFKLSFSGGPQAALDTPSQCGTYATTADFTPWSSPFIADAFPTGAFGITAGPGGGPCSSSPLPFSPSLTAGSTTDQAGGFTNFSLLLQRGDGQQRIERLQFKEPEGLAGMISSVPLCGEPQASSGECSEASKIGDAAVASGPGPYPLAIPQPGQPESSIFLTGPYEGAPFGLSIVTHVIAGPFNLGTIVTRAKIEVDPHTAQITVTTDPFPQIVDGVPTDLRLIDSVIDRPGFLFNPTTCTHQEFTGTAWGTPPPGAGGPGATAAISSPFSVGSCQSLKFAPRISFSTNGKTSKQNGADLITKVTYPSAPQGTYANVGSVKVELPKALPSRLTTLQKACLAKVFEANPAACPPESRIGYATVHTPVLPVPLTGPAIFVSHGGEAFPSLTMVLQGDGVTIDLVGTTFISKAGITSTTFKTVPDTPFSTFELVLPQGPYSALTANGNLCKQKLVIPNEWVGANEALLRQDSTVNVTGCREAIAVVGHKVRGKAATIQVNVPAAGKLVASGKGLSKASKQAKGASTLTVKLTLTNGEAALLSRHKGRKLKARINLTFSPRKGKQLKTATTVVLG
jgi:hypothetical protein